MLWPAFHSSSSLLTWLPPTMPSGLQGTGSTSSSASPDAIWVRTVGDGLLVRIDPKANRVVASIDVTYSLGRAGVDHLAVLDGHVWVCGISLQRIDPRTNQVSATVDIDATSVTTG